MKNTGEVLREKELELEEVRKEVEALRIVVPLLVDSSDALPKMPAQSEDWTSRRNGTTNSGVATDSRVAKGRNRFWP